MKVMVIVKASKASEAGELPSEQLLRDMGNYNEELSKAGIMLAGEGLHPTSKGKRVRFSGKSRTVIDGPFAETKELIAGYWIWRVKSMEEAVEWLKRCPNPHEEETEVEIRPIFEADDFGEAFTPELREQEAAILATNIGLNTPRFENAAARTVAGHNATYTFTEHSNIPTQWERFAPHIGKVPGQVGNVAYGVSWNWNGGENFDYLTGVEVKSGSALPAGFTKVDIPASRYAIFPHTGHVSAIGKTIEAIWKKWIPDCGLKPAHAPSFERYGEQYNPHTGMGGMEIWIPIAG